MIESFDATILIVDKFEEQKKFYADILGLEIAGDWGDAVFFKIGDKTLGLFSKDHHGQGTQRLHGAKKGLSHLEFGVKEKDREKIEEKLKKLGYHAYGDNFEDADGNLFHFNSK